jgi:hypothetical protein
VNGERLFATLLAFFLAVGIAAHAFDELRGRPLRTKIPSSVLSAVGAVSLGLAAVLGVLGIQRVGWGLAPFVVVGVFLVVAYNFEIWGGRFHNDVAFAASWGAFPLLTSYYAQTATIRPAAIAGAAFAYGLSQAQRTLSTEAREIRRRVASVAGERVYPDGSRLPISRASLLQPLERTLITLSWSACVLGIAMVVARAGY